MSESPKDDNQTVEMDNAESEPSDIALALGLHRVGTVFPSKKPQTQQPIQVLNARGMPARIRKKNKLFFDDNIVNERPHRMSPSKKLAKLPSPTKSPSKMLKKRKALATKYMRAAKERATVQRKHVADVSDSEEDDEFELPPIIEANRKVGQEIGLRLRNLLKLPKAHKWVSYEWFYSYIDKPLFGGDNDFQICLKESFPQLKTRLLTRVEWSKLRKMMGKPRRCSQAFFDEERRELERRRQKIRFLQSRKSGDLTYVKDLPNEIPLPLPIATMVTARLREPQDGIFTGTIDAVDSLSSIYRITFDRPGLGTHSVPDYEVIANDYSETISLSSLAHSVYHEKIQLQRNFRSDIGLSSLNKSDPLLGSEIFKNSKLDLFPKDTIGGFQLKLLELIIRTRKTLGAKQMKLLRLKNMNSEAEMYRSYGEELRDDYQRQYASIVIGMEKLNRDMQQYLSQIQIHARELTKDTKQIAMLAPSYLREKCKEMAVESVQKNNKVIINPAMLRLITDLATIMWIASNMSAEDRNSYVLNVLEGYLEEAKSSIELENVSVFQKNVHVHIRQIELDMARQNALNNNSKSGDGGPSNDIVNI